MTSLSDTARPSATMTELDPLRRKWGWIVALGVVYLVTGVVALGVCLWRRLPAFSWSAS